MDLKVNGSENRVYISRFSKEFQVEGQASVANFKIKVQNWDIKKQKLRVICAASLEN
jgi:hypothetical protein